MTKKKEKNYNQLYNKVNDVIDYTNKLITNNIYEDITILEDVILTEMNDLLFGIESNNLKLSNSKLELLSVYYITNGAVKDVELIRLLQDVQNEIYRIKNIIKHPINFKLYDEVLSFLLGALIMFLISFLILSITKNKLLFWILFFVLFVLLIADIIALVIINKFSKSQHYIFCNLPYEKCLYSSEYEYKGEDILTIGLNNNFQIDLGYMESLDEYVITIIKDGNWSDIIEEIKVGKRYNIEKILIDKINEYIIDDIQY